MDSVKVGEVTIRLAPPGDDGLWTAVATFGPWTVSAQRYHAPTAVAAVLEEAAAAIRAAYPRLHGWKKP